jgi:hypothetical protein
MYGIAIWRFGFTVGDTLAELLRAAGSASTIVSFVFMSERSSVELRRE